MYAAIIRISVIVLMAETVFGQTAESTPKFVAADVRHSKPIMVPSMIGPTSNGDLYHVRYAIMVDLIRMAYGVDKDKVVGGPIWISMYRYDIKAKGPAGSTPDAKRLMLQALLADRFHLVTHAGTISIEGYTLSAGKHPQLKQASGTEETGCRSSFPSPPAGGAAGGPTSRTVTVTCRNVTMQAFAETVRNLPRATRAQANPPIVDQTGLSGGWNFEFNYDVMATRGENNAAFVHVFDQQLSMKLEPGMVPAPVVEVQSMDFDPTPNPPDLDKFFPPLPVEFEVAEVKPSAPVAPGVNMFPEIRNGRVILPGFTLGALIHLAWDLEDMELVGAPKWLNTDRFDVVAKAPDGVRIGGVGPLDLEPLQLMLRNLLTQRFKLKVHTEDRPTDAYTLKAVKPKLTATSDPKRRAGWHDGPPYATKDLNLLNTAMGRVITCTNLSMNDFARLLPGMDPSAINHPVLDATGIEGTFDFTINFERYAILTGGRGGTIIFTPTGLGNGRRHWRGRKHCTHRQALDFRGCQQTARAQAGEGEAPVSRSGDRFD